MRGLSEAKHPLFFHSKGDLKGVARQTVSYFQQFGGQIEAV